MKYALLSWLWFTLLFPVLAVADDLEDMVKGSLSEAGFSEIQAEAATTRHNGSEGQYVQKFRAKGAKKASMTMEMKSGLYHFPHLPCLAFTDEKSHQSFLSPDDFKAHPMKDKEENDRTFRELDKKKKYKLTSPQKLQGLLKEESGKEFILMTKNGLLFLIIEIKFEGDIDPKQAEKLYQAVRDYYQ